MGHDYSTIICATRPWSATGAAGGYERSCRRRGDPTAPEREGRRARHRDGDSPEQIQMCLNCKLASCKNCVEVSPTMRKALMGELETGEPIQPKKMETRGRKPGPKTFKQAVRELMEQGYDERKIAWKLNADRTGIRNIMLKIEREQEK